MHICSRWLVRTISIIWEKLRLMVLTILHSSWIWHPFIGGEVILIAGYLDLPFGYRLNSLWSTWRTICPVALEIV